MVSHQRLVFLVIIFYIFMTKWFAYWSRMFDERVCPSKVGILAHARTLFSKCLKVGDVTDEEDKHFIHGIIPDMIIDARGRIAQWWNLP